MVTEGLEHHDRLRAVRSGVGRRREVFGVARVLAPVPQLFHQLECERLIDPVRVRGFQRTRELVEVDAAPEQ